MRRLPITLVLLAAFAAPLAAQTAAPAPAPAADPAAKGISAADIELMRQDLRANKKKITAETLKLTPDESTKFWPVYDKYIGELTTNNNLKYALIKEYADKFGSYTDAQALDLARRSAEVDVGATSLRAKYVPIVARVLPGVKAASFFQVDRRLAMLIDLQLASQLPLLQDQAVAKK